MLGIPAALIGNSIGQVYFQEATKEKQETGIAVLTFKRTSKKLFILSLGIFIPMYFVLPMVFEVVFGKEWKIAGEYAQIILPFVAAQFITAALSNTNNIFEKQKIALMWQIVLLVLSLTTIFCSNLFGYSLINFLHFFSLILFAHYALLYFILFRVSQGRL